MPPTSRNGRLPLPVHRLLYLLGGNQASVRLEIVTCLAADQDDVTSLAASLDLDIKTVSSHLRTLKHHGLVESKPHKQRRVYRLAEQVRVAHDDGQLKLVLTSEDGSEVRLALPERRRAARR